MVLGVRRIDFSPQLRSNPHVTCTADHHHYQLIDLAWTFVPPLCRTIRIRIYYCSFFVSPFIHDSGFTQQIGWSLIEGLRPEVWVIIFPTIPSNQKGHIVQPQGFMHQGYNASWASLFYNNRPGCRRHIIGVFDQIFRGSGEVGGEKLPHSFMSGSLLAPHIFK